MIMRTVPVKQAVVMEAVVINLFVIIMHEDCSFFKKFLILIKNKH